MVKKLFLIILLCLFILQQKIYSKSSIKKAELLFKNNNYAQAIKIFQNIISNRKEIDLKDFKSYKELEAYCYFRIGKCYYYQGYFAPAVRNFNKVIRNYNKTNYINKALFWKASAYYHLKDTSPCIDAGNPEAQYNDPDGNRNDMGKYPYE